MDYLRLDYLLPGDIILSSNKKGFNSNIIRTFTNSEYSHAEVVVSNFLRFEATGDGSLFKPPNIRKTSKNKNGYSFFEEIKDGTNIKVLRHESLSKFGILHTHDDGFPAPLNAQYSRLIAVNLLRFCYAMLGKRYPPLIAFKEILARDEFPDKINSLFVGGLDKDTYPDFLIGEYCSKLAVKAVEFAFNASGINLEFKSLALTPAQIEKIGFCEVKGTVVTSEDIEKENKHHPNFDLHVTYEGVIEGVNYINGLSESIKEGQRAVQNIRESLSSADQSIKNINDILSDLDPDFFPKHEGNPGLNMFLVSHFKLPFLLCQVENELLRATTSCYRNLNDDVIGMPTEALGNILGAAE